MRYRHSKNFTLLLCFSFLFLLFNNTILAQQKKATTLKGQVVDKDTKEPLAGVILKFNSSNIGTATDVDGYFSITNYQDLSELTFMYLGYEPLYMSVLPQTITSKTIEMKSKTEQLNEVVVQAKKEKYTKKDNPAVALIKKVVANKHKNSIKELDYYSYKEYEKYILAFNEFNPDAKMFKRYKFLPEYADTSIINNKPILPFSVKEKISDVYYRKHPKNEQRIVKGYLIEGLDQNMEQASIQDLLNEGLQTVDLTNNYITLLMNNFVGPLSSTQATSFYKWYLKDTIDIGKKSYIELDFAPFNSRDLGFTGTLLIANDSSYAVKKAILKTPMKINLSFVSALTIEQEFDEVEEGKWVPQSIRTGIDFTLYDAIKFYTEKETLISHFSEKVVPDSIFTSSPEIYEDNYTKQVEEFWVEERPSEAKDNRVGELIHKMKDVFVVKALLNMGNLLSTGYFPVTKDLEKNKLEIGTVPTFYSHNHVEGNRFRLTLNTTPNFNKHLYLWGYGAYGTKDKKFKYRGEVIWAFNKIKNHREEYAMNNLTFGYQYDMNALGQHFTQAERDNIFMSLTTTNKIKLTYDKAANIIYRREYYNGFAFHIGATRSQQTPAGSLKFEVQDEFGGIRQIKDMTTTDATLKLRYAHNDKFAQRRHQRIPIPSEKFIVEFDHTTSFKNLLGGDYSYNKSSLYIFKNFWFTPWGKLNLSVQGQKLWGEVPYPMLISPSANNSFTVQSHSFYLIDPMEFVSDQQISWEVYYRLGGLIFNRIPLLNRLKWREVVGFRGFYGTLSEKNNPAFNRNQMLFPEGTYTTTDGVPYMEYNIGIENIFGFFRIDYVQRLNYKNHPGINKNGVRFSFQMEF